MGEIVQGVIVGADADGLTVRIPYNDWQKYTLQGNHDVLVELLDGRHISAKQNRFAWALMTEIGLDAGYRKSEIEREIYRKFFAKRFALDIMPTLRKKAFHLSTATVQEGRQFINMLVDHCIENGVATAMPLTEYTQDIDHYVYTCAVNKKCCCCGRSKAEVHHVDHVGMGRDRTQINHIGMRFLPLCRECHMTAHSITDKEFCNKYHLNPIKIDQDIVRIYGLNKGESHE